MSLALVAGSAQAGVDAVVAVVPPAGQGLMSPLSAAMLPVAEKAARDDGLTLSTRAQLGELKDGKDVSGQVSKGKELLKSGVAAMDELDLAKARKLLGQAVSEFERAQSMELLYDALSMKALAAKTAGDESEAQKTLVQLFSLNPGYRVDPARASPQFSKAVEKARAKVGGQKVVSVSVETQPASASVQIDGIALATGTTSTQLQPGTHYISISAPGYVSIRERLPVSVGGPCKFKLEPLKNDAVVRLESLATAGSEKDLIRESAALAVFAEAPLALVVLLPQDAAEGVWVYKVDRSGQTVNKASAPAQKLDEATLGAAVRMAVAAVLKSATPAPPPPEKTPEALTVKHDARTSPPNTVVAKPDAESGGSVRPYIALGLVGACAVALAVAIGMGVSASGQAAAAGQIPQTDVDRYEAAMRGARGSALMADILYGVSAASAGAAALVYFTGGGSESEPKDDTPWSKDAKPRSAAPAQ